MLLYTSVYVAFVSFFKIGIYVRWQVQLVQSRGGASATHLTQAGNALLQRWNTPY